MPSGGFVLLTTVAENEAMLRSVLGAEIGGISIVSLMQLVFSSDNRCAGSLRKATFMPAMHRDALPYQQNRSASCVLLLRIRHMDRYSLFVNYELAPDSVR